MGFDPQTSHKGIEKFSATGSYFYDPLDGVKHDYTLIFLHGLGDKAETFYYHIFCYMVKVPKNCRVVLHTAPKNKSTCNNGAVINSWFDILKLDRQKKENLDEFLADYDQESLIKAADQLLQWVREEADRFEDKSTTRVFIGGLSQGCMTSLAAFLRH